MLGFFRVPDQLIDRLAGAKLFEQNRSPRPVIGGDLSIQEPLGSRRFPPGWRAPWPQGKG
jgi:hypothetical protein